MTPTVRDDILLYEQDGQEHILAVGTTAWFVWLDTASTFSFVSSFGHFTARREQSGHKRGGWYWKAYRKKHGKLSSRYLGKSETITLSRLQAMAQALSDAPIEASSIKDAGTVVSLPGHRTQGDSLTPLLATKLYPPHPREQLVRRYSLIERLQQGMSGPLTLISAPAGFGKTTLLAQWLAESSMPVAWISLEQEDNEPMRFLSYLIAALQTLDPRLGKISFSLLHLPQPAAPETVLSLLTNDMMSLERNDGDFALVLDDYHVIEAASIHHALLFLLEHLPPQMHLILLTRSDPPLPLSRLRARGQLNELRAAELRFTPEEVRAFLETVMGLDLSTEAITTLESRTEGWIAGLQFAALSLRDRTDVSEFLAAFTGSHRFVLDFLSEEVLARQPASVQTFLLHTSILDRLSGPLCEEVTGQADGQVMLGVLEDSNLFVASLDHERQWYRYHQLFVEVLYNHLRRTEPMLIPELHHRASVWYERQGLPIEAVQHALAASDVERAADLVEHIGISVGYQGQVHTVLKWLNALPDGLIRRRPALCIYHALTLIFIGQMEEAEARLSDAERCIHPDMPVEQAHSIQGQVIVIRGNIARYSGDLRRSVTLSLQALDLLQETQIMRAGAVVYAAQDYMVTGDVTPAAEHKAKAAMMSARTSNQLFISVRSIINLARLQVLQGRLHQATVTYKEVLRVTSGPEVLHVLTSGTAFYFGLADVLREWNDLDEASRYLAQGMEVLESGTLLVDADVVMLGHMTLARLQQARGAYSEALSILDAFMNQSLVRQIIPLLVAQVAAVRAHIELAQGNLSAALHWADTSGLAIDDADLSYQCEREYLTLVRVRIVQGRANQAGTFLRDILSLLARLLSDAEAKARLGSVLEILLLRSLTFDAQGDRTLALDSLEQAILLAEPEGYMRIFVDEGVPMFSLLQEVKSHGLVLDYVTKLLSAFGEQHFSNSASSIPTNSTLLEPLTARERDVLHLLVAGRSNAAIAQELVITLGTVKRHVNSIYGKLGVQSRTQAVARSHALHMF